MTEKRKRLQEREEEEQKNEVKTRVQREIEAYQDTVERINYNRFHLDLDAPFLFDRSNFTRRWLYLKPNWARRSDYKWNSRRKAITLAGTVLSLILGYQLGCKDSTRYSHLFDSVYGFIYVARTREAAP